jgi:hypothetical protein
MARRRSGKMPAGNACMTAHTLAPAGAAPPRFDAKFIEENRLLERYLDGKLPLKGARDLENWCREHPEYLLGLNLSDRAQASLKLLEASGKPLDLQEPAPPWWKSPYVSLVMGLIAAVSLILCWSVFGKHALLQSRLEEAQARLARGSLEPTAVASSVRVTPDRAPGLGHARVTVDRSAPQLLDLRIDMSYSKAEQFRLVVDKQEQGRALILNNVLRDSNRELRMTFNTTGIAAGIYTVRVEALPFHGSGSANPEGWLSVEVR